MVLEVRNQKKRNLRFGKERMLMRQDFLPIFIAVVVSAVMQVNLLSTFAIVEPYTAVTVVFTYDLRK